MICLVLPEPDGKFFVNLLLITGLQGDRNVHPASLDALQGQLTLEIHVPVGNAPAPQGVQLTDRPLIQPAILDRQLPGNRHLTKPGDPQRGNGKGIPVLHPGDHDAPAVRGEQGLGGIEVNAVINRLITLLPKSLALPVKAADQAQRSVSAFYRAFSDTAGTPYQQEIDTLGAFGVVSGSGDGSYQPNQTLDRASLCALLVKAMRYPMADGQISFADVPAGAWYAPYVDTLYEMGLVNGYDDGLFHPNDPITHEQFLVLMARVAKWLDMGCYEMSLPDGVYGNRVPSAAALAMEFGSFAAWAREPVWLSSTFAWTRDFSGIDPQAATTRAEAAAALFNLFWSSGLLNNA